MNPLTALFRFLGPPLTAIYAIVGGTVSRLTGGKFANGALTSAFQFLFNETTKWARRAVEGMKNVDMVRIRDPYNHDRWISVHRSYADQLAIAKVQGVDLTNPEALELYRAEGMCVSKCMIRRLAGEEIKAKTIVGATKTAADAAAVLGTSVSGQLLHYGPRVLGGLTTINSLINFKSDVQACQATCPTVQPN